MLGDADDGSTGAVDVRRALVRSRAQLTYAQVQADLDDLRRRVPPSRELEEVRWMLEELRISLFAQPMRTHYPVSPKRIWKAMDALLP